MTWLAFYAGLSAASWAVLRPMLRSPRLFIAAPPTLIAAFVPDATFDPGGFV